MRIIPKDTKVKMEFFKGIETMDILVGLAGASLTVTIALSNLPFRLYIAIAAVVITFGLLIRFDTDKTYKVLWDVIKHLAFKKHFARREEDKFALDKMYRKYKKAEKLKKAKEAKTAEALQIEDEQDTQPAEEKSANTEEKAKDSPKRTKIKVVENDEIMAESELKVMNFSSPEIAEWLGEEENPDTGEAGMAAAPEDIGEPGMKKGKIKKAKKEKKQFNLKDIVPFTNIDDGFIEYNGEYYGAVLEIPPVEFRFYSEFRQNVVIERALGGVLRNIGEDQSINLMKIDRPINYDSYLETEKDKTKRMLEANHNGVLSGEELATRMDIVDGRIRHIKKLNYDEKVVKTFHYLVMFGKDKMLLRHQIEDACAQLNNQGMNTSVLNEEEIAVFLRYTYDRNFDEREIKKIAKEDYMDWILPKKADFYARYAQIDGLTNYHLKVTDYPMTVGNAWGHKIFNLPNTKVVMKVKPMDRYKAIQRIDRSLDELRSQYENTGKASRIIEINQHIETLAELLRLLQSDNETLYDVDIYVTVYDYDRIGQGVSKESIILKRNIRRSFREDGFRLSDMWMRQFQGYVGCQVSAYDPERSSARGIHSTSIAAAFPFVHAVMKDEGGVNLGSSQGYPVFINFFKRDEERVNSNTVIIGKSGSGKSFATKTILSNLSADDCKIFILDPENEYCGLAKNFNGKVIDVGTAKQGRLNPFQVIADADDLAEGDAGDGEDVSVSSSFAAHLQFLESFFGQILVGISQDAMEYLNNVVANTYMKFGIDQTTDFSKMAPEDYPTFDDLYDSILEDYQKATGEYSKKQLRTLLNYISKFATGGRNAGLWNGPSSINAEENMVVFNFQSLLANKNNTIANAQMLLVLKYLDNEIIKNRDYNLAHNAQRRIIVVIDEAHVFIDEKFPVALDFMYQMAKRIRKYNGMQIIITQNVRDFVGSPEIARKSTAIINACQYSFIFALAPNDMNDLCTLYEKAGGINEMEQEQIVNNNRGQAFVVTSPTSRFMLSVEADASMTQYYN